MICAFNDFKGVICFIYLFADYFICPTVSQTILDWDVFYMVDNRLYSSITV